jgi:hypothetical protein
VLIAAIVLLVASVYFAMNNFYVSWLRYPLHRRFHPDEPYRFVSGIPLVGFILLCFSASVFAHTNVHVPYVWMTVVSALDTGNPLWIVPGLLIGLIKPKTH